MTDKNYALVDANGYVENYVVWGGAPEDFPHEGNVQVVLVENIDGFGVGWSYINGQFVPPPVVEPDIFVDQPAVNGAQTL